MIHKYARNYFRQKDIRNPDLIFDWTLCDKKLRKDDGLGIPIVLREGENCGFRSGCYAMMDFGYKSHPTVLYVGKALRLWNRIQTHFETSSIINNSWYFVDCDYHDGSGVIEVVCWLTDNREFLEKELIKKLKPLYNKQRN